MEKLEQENERVKEELMETQEKIMNFSEFQQKFNVFFKF